MIKQSILYTIFSFLASMCSSGCSSVPEQYQQISEIKSGPAITDSGRFVSVRVESVLAERNRLEDELEDSRRRREVLQQQLSETRTLLMEARVRLGLPAEPPKAQAECCNDDGYLKSYKPAPSLTEELKETK